MKSPTVNPADPDARGGDRHGPRSRRRSELPLLALVFVVAFGVRFLHWWGQMRHNPFFHAPIMDERMHHEWAQLIATGAGLGERPFFRAPLYYYMVAVVYALFGPTIAAARLVGVVIGALSCCLIARIGTLLDGPRVGLLAGLLAAFYWPLVHFDEQLLTVGLEIFLNLLVLWLLLAAVRRDRVLEAPRTTGATASSQSRLGSTGPASSRLRLGAEAAAPSRSRLGSLALYGLAGVAWGLSALARPNVLAFAPGLLIWLWVVLRAKRAPGTGARAPLLKSSGTPRRSRDPMLKNSGTRAPTSQPAGVGPCGTGQWPVTTARYDPDQWPVLSRIALVFLGAAITILPVTLRNRLVGGEWVLIATNGGVNFYIGNNPQADGIAAVVPGTRADWEGGYEDTHRIPEQELGRRLTEGEVSAYWFNKGWAWIRGHPGAWLRLTLHKLRLFWVPHEIPNNQPIRYFAGRSDIAPLFVLGFPPVAILGLAGLAALRDRRRLWSLPLLFGAITMATVVVFFCPARYRLPVVPILLLLTAAGVVRLPELWRNRRWRALGIYAAVAAAVAGFMVGNRPDAAWARQEEGRAYHNLGAHYARLGQGDPSQRPLALGYLNRAAELRPTDPYLRFSIGTWLTLFDRADEAGPHFARAVALLPTYAEARQSYGDWLLARGRMEAAVEQYQAALELRPDWVDMRYRLGRALARVGQMAAAAEQFERVVQQQPDAVPALLDLAAALVRLDRPADAVRYYREALRLQPGHVGAAQRLARTLFQLGQAAEAVAVLEAGLRQSPDNAPLRADLAGLLISTTDTALHDSARAAALVEEALALGAERSVALLDTLAAAYADLGQYQKAADLAREALAKAHQDGPATAVPRLEARLRQYEAGRSSP